MKDSTWNKTQSLDLVRIGVRTSVGLYSREDSYSLSTFGKKHQDKLGFNYQHPIDNRKSSNLIFQTIKLDLEPVGFRIVNIFIFGILQEDGYYEDEVLMG